jgi:hypothetical protein
MRGQIELRLSSLVEEIRGVRQELAMVQEHLAERTSVAADLWVRALVAETPLADRGFRDAERGRREVERRATAIRRRLAALEEERARIRGLLAGQRG